MKNILLLLFFEIISSVFQGTNACTSIIISGKATKDGRPMLFKNRDSYNFDNLAVIVQGEKYKYIAIVGAKDLRPDNAWSGHNEKGFAIMNTAAYNLNGKEGVNEDIADDKNRVMIMKRALEICSNLKDFETLLDTLPRPLNSNSNFGVMDAEGGCAYYETGNKDYVKFDANDPKIAPYGYLIRTNHAYSGDRKLDKGLERYMAISDFMLLAGYGDMIDKDNILQNVPRNLTHGLTKINLYKQVPFSEKDRVIVPFKDFIPRYQSTSTMLTQGVKKGESPLLTVSWTIVGSPLTSVAVPLCIIPSGKIPSIVTRGKDGYSRLTSMSLELKDKIFPLKRGNYMEYIDLSKLINQQNTGILQKIMPIENEILKRGNALIDKMRAQGKFNKEMDDYYNWIDSFISSSYHDAFGL